MDFCAKCGKGITDRVFCADCAPEEFRHVPKRTRKGLGRKPDVKLQKDALVSPEYFEGILQLRCTNPDTMEAVFQFVERSIKRQGKVQIPKVVEQPEGVDVYFSDKRFMRNLAAKVRNSFGGSVNQNPQLFSRNKQTSKDIFRLNVLVQLPPYRQGDVLWCQGKVVKVLSLAKVAKAKDLLTNTRLTVKHDADCEVLREFSTRVSRLHPAVEVIHPQTYQSVQPANSQFYTQLAINQKVKVVVKNGIYIVD